MIVMRTTDIELTLLDKLKEVKLPKTKLTVAPGLDNLEEIVLVVIPKEIGMNIGLVITVGIETTKVITVTEMTKVTIVTRTVKIVIVNGIIKIITVVDTTLAILVHEVTKAQQQMIGRTKMNALVVEISKVIPMVLGITQQIPMMVGTTKDLGMAEAQELLPALMVVEELTRQTKKTVRHLVFVIDRISEREQRLITIPPPKTCMGTS